MNLLATNEPNIPLHCNVCPKKPDFSDVSHLLTHVASKGHLSHYYKLKVKATIDPVSQKTLDDYDEWYEEWNLDELMRERMNQKERKRGSSNGAASRRTSGANGSGRSTPAAQPQSQPRGRRETRLRENLHLLDPQLGNKRRIEQMSRSATPISNYSIEVNNLQRGMPPLANWGQGNLDMSDSPFIKQESFGSTPSDEDDDDFEYNPRTAQAPRRRRYPSVSAPSILDDENSLDGLANDNTRLKGVIWPGMDLFDSATPDMRRKRNQKKNVSVLHALQATSEIVEPTECVFDTNGVLRKEREITGNPDSEDSLIEGESEPEPDVTEKKQRPRRRPRPAMVEKNVNNGRVLRSRREPHHPTIGRRTRGLRYQDEDDDDLTFGQPRPKKRTGPSIHRDNTGPDVSFEQPAPMNYLTAGLRHPLQNSMMAPQQQFQNNFIPRVHSRQPSWGQMNGTFRSAVNNNSLTTQNLSSFGAYFQNGAHPNAAATGHYQPTVFQQQQFGLGSHHGGHGMYQAPNTGWDMFGFDGPDMNMFGNDTGFNVDVPPPNNNLFLSSTKEDDEATISAKSDC